MSLLTYIVYLRKILHSMPPGLHLTSFWQNWAHEQREKGQRQAQQSARWSWQQHWHHFTGTCVIRLCLHFQAILLCLLVNGICAAAHSSGFRHFCTFLLRAKSKKALFWDAFAVCYFLIHFSFI